MVTAQWPDIGSNWVHVRPCTSVKIIKRKPCRGFELCRQCVCVCVCVRASVIPPLAMFPHNQSGYFSGNTSGRRPIWSFFGLPAIVIEVGHGFPQTVHMNVGVVFE